MVYNCHLEEEQGEIDVIALDPQKKKVYLCEVANHLRGLVYGNGTKDTLRRVEQKIWRAFHFAEHNFPDWQGVFMLWSPVVSRAVADSLEELASSFSFSGFAVEFIINKAYTARVNLLREAARKDLKVTDEPAFRLLQILEHLR